jgi:hypothetical protein
MAMKNPDVFKKTSDLEGFDHEVWFVRSYAEDRLILGLLASAQSKIVSLKSKITMTFAIIAN